jgi:hypothetical protein
MTAYSLNRLFKIMLVALCIDIGAAAVAILPSLFGFVGSEAYEWTTLAVIIIAFWFGVLLSIGLLILGFIIRYRAR